MKMAQKMVIIGGGDAGTYTLEAIFKKGAEVLKQFNIALVKKEKGGSASICAVPFALQGVFPMKDVAEIDPPEMFIGHGVDYRTETEATNINLENNTVSLSTREELKYDYLVIGTGRKPRIPAIDGTDLDGVFTLSTVEDGEKIAAAMNAPKANNAAVLGCGTIGLQVALAFLKKGLKTTLVSGHPTPLSSCLDPDMGTIVRERLEKEGATFIVGKSVDALKGDGGSVKSVVVEGEEIPADIVVISKGMLPNVDLAKNAGIEIGETGGIVTDQFLHVKKGGEYINNVYAVGDCVEVLDAITLRPRLSQFASSALVQAKVIVNNILGVSYPLEPALSPAVAAIADLQVGSVGITSATAEHCGIRVVSGKKEKPTKARFYPGRKSMAVKLLFDAYSERLIGAQIISEEMVADRIDGLCNAIRMGMTAKELSRMEKSFDPCVSLHRDVMIDATEKAVEQLTKGKA
ncbi:MAG: FAD-dependent oxidoreductase [Candidatus Methanospirareceae archaeon]